MTAHIIASLAVLAVMTPALLHHLSERGVPVGMRVVAIMLATALAPLWVPAIIFAAPVYALIKGIVPSHWLAIQWATYLIVGSITFGIRRRAKPHA
jgi:hypothetical protein